MFEWLKKQEQPVSNGLATYLERLTILEARVSSLELSNDTFRNQVLRKIQSKTVEVEESPRKLTLPGQKVRR